MDKLSLNVLVLLLELIAGLLVLGTSMYFSKDYIRIFNWKQALVKPIVLHWSFVILIIPAFIIHLLFDGLLQGVLSIGAKDSFASSALLWHAATVSFQMIPVGIVLLEIAARVYKTSRTIVQVLAVEQLFNSFILFVCHWLIDGIKSALRNGPWKEAISTNRTIWFFFMAADQCLHLLTYILVCSFTAGGIFSGTKKVAYAAVIE